MVTTLESRKPPPPDFALDPEDLACLCPSESVALAQWADANIVLDPEYTPVGHGPYNHARTPYFVGIWEAETDRTVQEITFMKPSQIGGTLGCTVIPIAFSVAENPGPGMLMMPTDDDAREMKDRLDKALASSPNLRQFLPTDKGDDLRTQVRYGGTTVYFRGSNSARKTARVACLWVRIDEADKTATTTSGGKEPGAILLARHRLRLAWAAGKGKLVVNGTPSLRVAPMWQRWEKSDQRRFWCPCPHCGAYQVLEFSRIRWPKDATADDVERDKSATYHCEACGQEIETYREKPAMVARGVWVAKGGRVLPDGKVVGEQRTAHAGFHLNALYSPWLTWSQIAVEHLRAVTIQDRQDFTNGYLGWIFEEQVDRISAGELQAKAGGYKTGDIPEGVLTLTCGVDCGAKDVHYEVRGWGLSGETWLLEAGRVGGVDLKSCLLEFDAKVLQRQWRRGESVFSIRRCFIDAGYKPHRVARFCRGRRVCRAVIGRDENPGRMILRSGTIEKNLAGQAVALPVLVLDINEIADQIADTMHSKDAKWHVPDDVPEQWFRHLSAEHAVLIKGKKRWQPIPGGGANHWGDACRYSFAAGYALGMWSMRDGLAPVRRPRPTGKPKPAPAAAPNAAPTPFVLPIMPPGMGRPGRPMRAGSGFSSRSGFRTRR